MIKEPGRPLSEFTTMGVGGVPQSHQLAETSAELYDLCRTAWAAGDDFLLLGGGSNVVIADEVPTLNVVRAGNLGIETEIIDSVAVRVRVQAGENWDQFVGWCVSEGLAGIEAMSGIPGSVGATPVQNVGAYGQEVSQVITGVEFLERGTRKARRIAPDNLHFGYRDSALKHGLEGAIGWVEFELQRLGGMSVPMASGQITNALGEPYGSQLPLRVVRETVLELRSRKGMVVRQDDPDTRSCGSFFTNPVVPYESSLRFPHEMTKWTMNDETGSVKLSAAWLIEHSGIERGFSLSGSRAAISSKHALAITNRGGATAEEVLELARHIQERVAAKWGINLVPEPNLIGF